MARKEIVDYVTGLGLAVLDKEEREENAKRKRGPSKKFNLHNYGWNRRLKVGMQSFLEKATQEDLKEIGLKNKALLENRDTAIKRAIQEGKWEGVHGVSDANMAKTSRTHP